MHFHAGAFICAKWINMNQVVKLEEISRELAIFVQRRCGCLISITSAWFTCHHDAQHVIYYKAGVGVSTVGVSREELEAALEEWPRTHRSILLQGQRLSVEQNCPVIINSMNEEVCKLTTAPTMVSIITFLLTVAADFVVTLLGTVAMVLLIYFIYAKRSKKK